MRAYLLAILFTAYIRILGWTSKIKYIGEENIPPRPFIYAFWHNRLLLVSYTHRGRAIRVLASTSKDGDVSVLGNRQFGHRIIRGTSSSTREGAKTAIKIITSLKEGNVVAITPDGPTGPALEVKKGTPYMAQKAGCPVVPVSWAVKRKVILNTWDKFVLPLPFNKCIVVTGRPVYVGPSEDIEKAAIDIKNAINDVTKTSELMAEKS